MDRTIVIEVNGSYIRKDSNMAGVTGEGNSRFMNIIFDESWLEYAKTVTFWDAKGENPVKRVLTTDYLTNPTVVLDYTIPIPAEALTCQGKMTFVIDGSIEGARKRSVSDKLKVEHAPQADDANDPVDPTPSQFEQIQAQVDKILPDMIEERLQAQEARNEAVNAAEEATASAESASSSAGEANESKASAIEAARIAVEAQANIEANAQLAQNAATSATESAQSASASASSASASASSAGIYSTQTADYAAAAGIAASNAKTAETNANASALTASTAASNAKQSETRAGQSESNAKTSEEAAKEAQRLAEKARDEAQGISGGDFASRAEAQGYANQAEANAKAYTDQKVANIPTPDVSGQISEHNADANAHPSIRTALSDALGEAKSYTDQKIAAIPTPDVSGQIGTHNSDETAHPYIRGLIGDVAEDVTNLGAAISANTTAIGQKASQADLNALSTSTSQQIQSVQATANEAKTAATNAQTTAEGKAPMYTYGTTDLEAGVTPLETGRLHFVFE